MPGLLTPERRLKVRQRSRANHGGSKKSSRGKGKPSYQAMAEEETPNKVKPIATTSPNSVMEQPKMDQPIPKAYSDRLDEYDDDDATSGLVSTSQDSPLMSSPTYYSSDDMRYASDEEMPMDEMMGMKETRHLQTNYNLGSTNSIVSSSETPSPSHSSQRMGKIRNNVSAKPTKDTLGLSNLMKMVSPSNWNSTEQDLVDMESTESSTRAPDTGIQRIIYALKGGQMVDKPSHLSKEESHLWDTLHSAIENVRKDLLDREMELKRQQVDMEQKYTAMSIVVEKHKNSDANNKDERTRVTDSKDVSSLLEELKAKDSLLKEQEDTHITEVLAIQRVLADMTSQKTELEDRLQRQENAGTSNGSAKNEEISPEMQDDTDELKKDLIAANREVSEQAQKIIALEVDSDDVKAKLKQHIAEKQKLEDEANAAHNEIKRLQTVLDDLASSSKGEGDSFKTRIGELEAEISALKLEYEKLHVDKMELEVARTSALDEAGRLKAQNEHLEEELQKGIAEREKLKQEVAESASEIEKLLKAKQHAVSEVEKAISEAKAVRAGHGAKDDPDSEVSEDEVEKAEKEDTEKSASISKEQLERLQKNLAETSSSLETSKQIIASLEKANGSLAVDSRSKLKEKDEELAVVQKESEERKRHLDSLATELRDLQRKQGDVQGADRRTKMQVIKQRALMDRLESSLSDLQAAVVVHESISEDSNMEQISEILSDTLHAISATLDSAEDYFDEVDDTSVVDTDLEYAEMNSEVGRQIDAIVRNDREVPSMGLKHELDQKKIAVKRLEEALKKQNEEMKRMRSHFDARGREDSGNSEHMRAEIQSLRRQCATNMEVLAKKERELSVLKSSLKVDENESGYISDDASDDEDDGTEVGSILSAPKLNAYGPADAEAYATILSQANGRIGMPGAAQVREIESLKKDLMEALGEKESASKELQARRESLANAKMIISSLEKANKGMMEDLRSRLEDSNIAISSLLEKSKEHEQEAGDLRQTLEKVKRENLEEREKLEEELRQLRKLAGTRNEKKGTGSPLEEKKEEFLELEGPV